MRKSPSKLKFYFPPLVVWGRYCACEILIANPIDWLFSACLEYFFFLDSSEARKQYDEYCLSIMQTITYALSIGGWFKRMELIEVNSLIWTQKGKLYIIYENVMWIQWTTIPVWWQKKRYCSDMPNVVSAIDGTSHEIQIPSNEPQQKTYFQQTNSYHWLILKRKFINSDNHKFHQYQ